MIVRWSAREGQAAENRGEGRRRDTEGVGGGTEGATGCGGGGKEREPDEALVA